MDLDDLRCFDAAARLLRFRAAARAVALTPAALGQRIKALEEELGVRLFERTTRHVALTEAGHRAHAHARACLAAAADTARAAKGDLGPPEIELVVGTRHELGIGWLTPSLPALRASHPAWTLHLYFGSGPDLLVRVRTLEIDCAVTSSRLTDPSLDAVPLHPEAYVFVGAPRLLDKRPFRKPADAEQHVLIDAAPELPLYGYLRDAGGGAEDMRFARVLRIGTIEAIRQLVVAGEGVAVLPAYLVADDLRSGALRRILPKLDALPDQFRLVFRRKDPRRPVFEAVATALRQRPLPGGTARAIGRR